MIGLDLLDARELVVRSSVLVPLGFVCSLARTQSRAGSLSDAQTWGGRN